MLPFLSAATLNHSLHNQSKNDLFKKSGAEKKASQQTSIQTPLSFAEKNNFALSDQSDLRVEHKSQRPRQRKHQIWPHIAVSVNQNCHSLRTIIIIDLCPLIKLITCLIELEIKFTEQHFCCLFQVTRLTDQHHSTPVPSSRAKQSQE